MSKGAVHKVGGHLPLITQGFQAAEHILGASFSPKLAPEVWEVLHSLLQGDLGHAAAVQPKAEDAARVHQDG